MIAVASASKDRSEISRFLVAYKNGSIEGIEYLSVLTQAGATDPQPPTPLGGPSAGGIGYIDTLCRFCRSLDTSSAYKKLEGPCGRKLAVEHKLLLASAFRETAKAGGLISYGPSIPRMVRHAAVYLEQVS
jgi:hypothetical protein